MLKLLKVDKIYTPAEVDAKEILIAGGRIIALGNNLSKQLGKGLEVEVIDGGEGSIATPGLIDHHVHILGGGGEGGYHTRVPEITLTGITSFGVTTVVGMLGTDDLTRHLESLVAKARALDTEGISTYILTGSYSVPTPTLTGSVKRDLVLIDKVIGAGEIALSDHRSSKPSWDALRDLATQCRLGGLISGKAGILHIHLGDEPSGLAPVKRLVDEGVIPCKQVVITHVNRNNRLSEEAVEFLAEGGHIDLTAYGKVGSKSLTATEAVQKIVGCGLPLDNVTLSSDANGSLPEFDEQGRLIGLRAASMGSLLKEVHMLHQEKVLPLDQIIRLVTKNPASLLGLSHKGEISRGMDGDITVFDDNLQVQYVLGRGTVLVAKGQPVVKGTFED